MLSVVDEAHFLLRKIRRWVLVFVVMLILSGLTAFPIQTGINFLAEYKYVFPGFLAEWILTIQTGINDTWPKYPFIAYGTDWLAFAHIVIGMAFIGVYKNPVRNIWIIHWGMLNCVAVIPLALICGPLRNIPWFHILIDCSFGIIGLIPLYIVLKLIRKMEAIISVN